MFSRGNQSRSSSLSSRDHYISKSACHFYRARIPRLTQNASFLAWRWSVLFFQCCNSSLNVCGISDRFLWSNLFFCQMSVSDGFVSLRCLINCLNNESQKFWSFSIKVLKLMLRYEYSHINILFFNIPLMLYFRHFDVDIFLMSKSMTKNIPGQIIFQKYAKYTL